MLQFPREWLSSVWQHCERVGADSEYWPNSKIRSWNPKGWPNSKCFTSRTVFRLGHTTVPGFLLHSDPKIWNFWQVEHGCFWESSAINAKLKRRSAIRPGSHRTPITLQNAQWNALLSMGVFTQLSKATSKDLCELELNRLGILLVQLRNICWIFRGLQSRLSSLVWFRHERSKPKSVWNYRLGLGETREIRAKYGE